MSGSNTFQKNALISVSDKKYLNLLVPFLEKNNYCIYSTGTTYSTILSYIKDKSVIKLISDYTEYPEICDGRVKTLHPRIFGGILAMQDNDKHVKDIEYINAKIFDLVVVNLYPFEQVSQLDNTDDTILENIDIGGHSLIRAASKNYKYIYILSDPSQYVHYIEIMNNNNNLEYRKQLAKIAMQNIMKYDIAISNWFNKSSNNDEVLGITYTKQMSLKYGLNPHMTPSSVYTKNNNKIPFEILNGQPGYINLLDLNYAIKLVIDVKTQLNTNCCASFKHNSPAGVSILNPINYSTNSSDIFVTTRNIDPKSSFGDIIGYSGVVDQSMAIILKKYISDGIIASDFTEDALNILKTKKQNSYLIMKQENYLSEMEFRDINGITLVQPTNIAILEKTSECMKNIPENIKINMILGYITLKYTQSNCICIVFNGKVIGIGSGQQNRVDCIRIAGNKAVDWFKRHNINMVEQTDIIMVSDAFLPFIDNVEVAAEYNIKYILQPGGSIRDNQILEACKLHNIKIVLSNLRAFTH